MELIGGGCVINGAYPVLLNLASQAARYCSERKFIIDLLCQGNILVICIWKQSEILIP